MKTTTQPPDEHPPISEDDEEPVTEVTQAYADLRKTMRAAAIARDRAVAASDEACKRATPQPFPKVKPAK